MQWSQIPFRPTDRVLRQFAGLLLGSAVVGALVHGEVGLWSAGVGLVATVGLARPQALRWLFVSWMVAVFPIGWVVAHVVLALLFFGIVAPLALVFRLMGRDVLRLRRPEQTTTYWVARPAPGDAASYLRQY